MLRDISRKSWYDVIFPSNFLFRFKLLIVLLSMEDEALAIAALNLLSCLPWVSVNAGL